MGAIYLAHSNHHRRPDIGLTFE